MAKKPTINKPFVMVKPTFKKGAGIFTALSCPEGHLIRYIRHGELGEARKIKKIKCYACGRENGAKPYEDANES